jgi:hypothetical protein
MAGTFLQIHVSGLRDKSVISNKAASQPDFRKPYFPL